MCFTASHACLSTHTAGTRTACFCSPLAASGYTLFKEDHMHVSRQVDDRVPCVRGASFTGSSPPQRDSFHHRGELMSNAEQKVAGRRSYLRTELLWKEHLNALVLLMFLISFIAFMSTLRTSRRAASSSCCARVALAVLAACSTACLGVTKNATSINKQAKQCG